MGIRPGKQGFVHVGLFEFQGNFGQLSPEFQQFFGGVFNRSDSDNGSRSRHGEISAQEKC